MPMFQCERYRTTCIILSQGNIEGTDLTLSKYPNLFVQYLLCPSFPITNASQNPIPRRTPGRGWMVGDSLPPPTLCAPPPPPSQRASHRQPSPKPHSLREDFAPPQTEWVAGWSYRLKDSKFTYQYRLKQFAKLPFRNNYHLAVWGAIAWHPAPFGNPA